MVVYHLAPELDPQVKAACGPGACILNETLPAFRRSYETIGPGHLTALWPLLPGSGASPPLGTFVIRNLILVGFSEGCQGPRTQLLAGVKPSGIVAIDGIHASKPPAPSQINPWQDYLTQARESHAVFSHTFTAIKPEGYLSTTETAAIVWQLTGSEAWSADEAGGVACVQLEQGFAWLQRFPGSNAPAHIEQARKVLPARLAFVAGFLAQHAAPWTIPERGAGKPALPPPLPSPPPPKGGTGPGPLPPPAWPPAWPPVPPQLPPPRPSSSRGAGSALALVVVGGLLVAIIASKAKT